MSQLLRSIVVVALNACVAFGTSTAVRAQDHQVGRSPALLPDSLNDLLQLKERTDAYGIRAGSFVLLPTIATSIVVDDNVFAARTGRSADSYWRVDPELRIVSDWSRHAMEVYVAGAGLAYDTYDSETRAEWRTGVSSLVEIRRDLWVRSFAKIASAYEERGVGDAVIGLDKPVHVQSMEAGTLVHKRFNRLWLEAAARLRRDDYDDGAVTIGGVRTVVDQDFRDAWRSEIIVRAGYEFSDRLSAFVETGLDWRHHSDDRFNSEGTRVLAGLRYEFTRALYGETAVGHLHQDVATGKQAIDTVALRAKVRWEPTPLIAVALLASRDVGTPSPLQVDSNSIVTQAGIRVDYSPRRDLTLSFGTAYIWQDYVDIAQTEESLRASVGAEYRLNRYLSIFANYATTVFDANGLTSVDFDRNVVAAGLRARY